MKSNNQFLLLSQKRFLPFFITQFLGAFNDNVFKNALIIMIAFQGAQFTDINANTLTNLSAGLFILPFFLLSATAGQWIDKTEKSRAIKLIKLLEIMIMMLAAVAFYYGQLFMLIALLFLMGSQSTLFGPAKYSYIPQHLKPVELVGGNALVQTGTFIAILAGTILGGNLIATEQGRIYVGLSLVVIAIGGYLASLGIPRTPSVDPGLKINWNIFTETARNIRFIAKKKTVFLSVLGISWFWLLGATYLVQLPSYTKEFLGGSEQVVTLFLAMFMIGIGVGSMLCNVLSGQKLEIGLVPFGSIGLTVFGVDLYFAKPEVVTFTMMTALEFLQQPHSFRIMADISLIGIFGGFYIVPLFSLVQQRSDPAHLSRVIAGNNVLNALFMVLSAIIAIILVNTGYTTAQILLFTAIANAFVALYIYTLVPEFLMRFIVWMLIHTIYHVRKQGYQNIPDKGPALLVCNHVSYVDPMIIAGCIRRPVRFVMYYKIYNLPLMHFVFKTARAIPIAGVYEDRKLLDKSFEDIAQALDEDHLVCVFPEGTITRTGEINRFKSGIKKVLDSTPVPVIPMALRGLWGSAFSRHSRFFLWRIAYGFRARVDLVIDESIPPDQATPELLEKKVRKLRGDRK